MFVPRGSKRNSDRTLHPKRCKVLWVLHSFTTTDTSGAISIILRIERLKSHVLRDQGIAKIAATSWAS